MNEAQLMELEKAHLAATPPKWEACLAQADIWPFREKAVISHRKGPGGGYSLGRFVAVLWGNDVDGGNADALVCVKARNALPDLIGEIRRLRGAIAEHRQKLETEALQALWVFEPDLTDLDLWAVLEPQGNQEPQK